MSQPPMSDHPSPKGEREDFDAWIEALEVDVVQGEYGYEPGEFTVYPEHWRWAWRGGLTPATAFRRALDAYAEARRAEEERRRLNWDRIKAEDAALQQGERS